MGRPPIDDPRDKTIVIRLTDTEHNNVTAASNKAGMSISSFGRKSILDEVDRRNEATKEAQRAGYDIWLDGHLESGVEGEAAPAHKVTTTPVQARSFDHAVRKYVALLPDEEAANWRREHGQWFFGGTRALPTENDARDTLG